MNVVPSSFSQLLFPFSQAPFLIAFPLPQCSSCNRIVGSLSALNSVTALLVMSFPDHVSHSRQHKTGTRPTVCLDYIRMNFSWRERCLYAPWYSSNDSRKSMKLSSWLQNLILIGYKSEGCLKGSSGM
jgi:hypothetical protein